MIPRVDYDLPKNRKEWNGLVLVGEAPGSEEVRLGRPFVGRSGKLLDELLAEAGIQRSHCLIANVFRFQPPGNKVDYFFSSKRAAIRNGCEIDESLGRFGSSWCKKEYFPEISFLRNILHQWHPSVVIALGRTPLWALTGENGLLSKAGQWLDCRLLPGVLVIPTFHPSYILRGNWSKRLEWLDHFVAAAHHVAQK
jgi:uracil-DNA glycosylase